VATYSGTIKIYSIISNVPTLSPTTPPPTLQPSSRPPTPAPTLRHKTDLLCPPYEASNTNSAQQNTVPCSFILCPYDTVTISLCAGACTSDTFIYLYDSFSNIVGENDDDCGLCSRLSYSYTRTTVHCEEHTLQQGCFGNNFCSSQSTISITSSLEVVKYSFAVYFVNDTSTVSADQGVLVNYHYNQKTSETPPPLLPPLCSSLPLPEPSHAPPRSRPFRSEKIIPVSRVVNTVHFLEVTDELSSATSIFIKWRPVFVDFSLSNICESPSLLSPP
jgi:hypothetical protein